MSEVHLIGVPLDLGAGRRGTDMGPSALRVTGLPERLASLGHDVRDTGNVDVPLAETSDEGDPSQRYVATISAVCRRLARVTRETIEAGAVPLVLGGDHSIAMGSVGGVAAALSERGQAAGLIWVDAHGDSNTPQSSPSGNVHGMPLAALLNRWPSVLQEITGEAPAVQPEHTVLLGVRDLDRREQELVRTSGVRTFTMADIDRHGIAAVVEESIEIAGAGTAGIYVSLDLDAVDPLFAPGVGTPVRGGLTYRESHLLMELVAESQQLLGMDLVEINPSLDVRNETALLATELALSAFGKSIL